MSEADGTEPPKRRTIVIGEPSLDLAPGSGPIIDPLLIPFPDDTRPDANRTTAAMVLPDADTTVTLADPPSGGGGLRTVLIGGSDEDDLPATQRNHRGRPTTPGARGCTPA